MGCLGAKINWQGWSDSSLSSNVQFFANIARWFALIRIWTPWLAPRHGKTHFDLDKEAITCSFLNSDGKHIVLLAISGVNNVMTLFKSDSDGNVVMEVC